MSGTILRRRDRTARPPRVEHYSSAVNTKNRVDLETEEVVVAYAVEYPAHGQVRVSNELRKRGVFVSPSGVRSIWLPTTWLTSRRG